MSRLFLSLTIAVSSLACQAKAAADDPVWTLSASGSWSELERSDRDTVSTSFSLSRRVGEASVGASLGTSNGSDALFVATEITDRSSVFGALFVTFPVGPSDASLTVSYGQEDYDGAVIVSGARFDVVNGSAVDLTSKVDSFAVNAAVSRLFTAGNWDIIPNAGLGWSRSDATTTATVNDAPVVPRSVIEEQSGLTATIGLGGGYVISERLYLFSDIVGLYAENGAASGIAATSRMGDFRATSRQDTDEAIWAEISFGASLNATDTVTLGLVGGTTSGRDDEEVFATTTLSIGF